MGCGIVAEHNLEILWPSVLLLSGWGAEKVMEGPVKPLTMAVSLLMVMSGSRLLDVQLTQLLDNFKTATLV